MAKSEQPSQIACPRCSGTGLIDIKGLSVGDLICSARHSMGLTQEELSQRVGVSRAHVASLENGRSDLPLKTLARFAEVLNCSMKDLVP